jgi:predicted alpha/beta-fold hydrolase
VVSARDLYAYDDAFVAARHGFRGADDYYARASTLPELPGVRVPTLCISGEDDPFYPAAALAPAREAASPQVRLIVTPWGGHTGFVTGPWPWRPVYWAEEAAMAWLARHAR